MNDENDSRGSAPDWLKPGEERFSRETPSGARVLRLFLRAFVFTLLFELLLLLPGEPGFFIGGVIVLCALLAWFNAASLLLVDSGASRRRKWPVLLGGSALCLALAPSWEPGWIIAFFSTFAFLFFRKYKPYKKLTSRRRAIVFFLIAVISGVMVFSRFESGTSAVTNIDVDVSSPYDENGESGSRPGRTPGSLDAGGYSVDTDAAPAGNDGFIPRLRSLFSYLTVALMTFYFMSLIRIFMGVRLHFLKLRPKLAVSAFLLTVVPFVLVVIMGLLVCYHTLGTTRAQRVESLLDEWARLATSQPQIFETLSGETFTLSRDGDGTEHLENPAPWAPAFSEALLFDPLSPFSSWSGADTTALFSIGDEVWMIGILDAGEDSYRLHGAVIDTLLLDRISEMLHNDVFLSSPLKSTLSTQENTLLLSDEQFKHLLFSEERHGATVQKRGTRTGGDPGFLSSIFSSNLYFGMTSIKILHFDEDRFSDNLVLVMLETSLADIVDELLSFDNPLSLITMALLAALALLLLVLELFALFFGVRITTGILSAINALVKGTRRISDGDLDTRIDIPNQDELGRLADSFNRMTTAVKRGIEEAVLREQLEQELKTARKIQERLLPSEIPSIPGFDICGTSMPSRFVGGDYFDFLDLGEGRLGIAIGDVSGKGIPAALLMSNLQASLHVQTLDHQEVSGAVKRMNEQLVRSTDPHMFASFFYGVLDRGESVFTAANAGHNPPLLFRVDGRIEKFEAGGILLGIRAGSDYGQQSASIAPGEVVVLYTDGVTEALKNGESGEDAEMFGEDRLEKVVLTAVSLSAEAIKRVILSEVAAFTNNTPLSDDITLVVLKRNPGDVDR